MSLNLIRTAGNRCVVGCVAISIYAGESTASVILPEILPAVSAVKISGDDDIFQGEIEDGDRFGRSVTTLGDLNLDGVIDIAVGARSDDDGQTDAGAIWILFMNADGSVMEAQKISDTMGGLTPGDVGGQLDEGDFFGYSIRSLGDLNGDGIQDLTATAARDTDAGDAAGAVYHLYLNTDGTVLGQQKISDVGSGLPEGLIGEGSFFGESLGDIGDFNGDGIPDVAVGAPGVDRRTGELHILMLNADGSVSATQTIGQDALGQDALGQDVLSTGDSFSGRHVINIGDLNGDQIDELAVSAYLDDDGGDDTGAFYVLFFDEEQNLTLSQKVSATSGGVSAELSPGDLFGMTLAPLGDIDGDGVPDLAVGSNLDDDVLTDSGALFLFLMNADGTIKAERKISLADLAGFDELELLEGERFGRSLSLISDGSEDGLLTLAVGSGAGDDGGSVWLLTFAVPEPSSAGLLGTAACLLLGRRRRACV